MNVDEIDVRNNKFCGELYSAASTTLVVSGKVSAAVKGKDL